MLVTIGLKGLRGGEVYCGPQMLQMIMIIMTAIT